MLARSLARSLVVVCLLPIDGWAQQVALNGPPCTFTSIQDAIDAASPGDRVLVEVGHTYVEALTIGKGLTFRGAPAGCTNLTPLSGVAIVDPPAGLQGAVINTAGAYVTFERFSFMNGEGVLGGNISATGTNLRLVNSGVVGGTADNHGGGIFVNFGTLVLDNSDVFSNEAGGSGGGVYVNGGQFVMSGGSNFGNEAPEGGGVYVQSAPFLTIEDGAIVRNNTASRDGGCVFTNSVDSVTLRDDSVIRGCSAGSDGGAMFIGGADEVLFEDQVVIEDSEAKGPYGGGLVYAQGTVLFTITDNVRLSRGVAKNGSTGGLIALEGGALEVVGTAPLLEGGRAENGGAVWAYGDNFVGPASVLLGTGAVLKGNSARGKGGAVALNSASFRMEGNARIGDSVSPNTAQEGGGVYARDSELVLYAVDYIEIDGAGIPVLTGAFLYPTIIENSATESGGGLHLENSSLTAEGAVLYRNRASGGPGVGEGGGVALYEGSTASFLDSLIQGNRARQRGGGMFAGDLVTVSFTGTSDFGDTNPCETMDVPDRYCAEIRDNEAGRPNDLASGEGGAVYVEPEASVSIAYAAVQNNGAQVGAPHAFVDVGGELRFDQALVVDAKLDDFVATNGVVSHGSLTALGTTFGGTGTTVRLTPTAVGVLDGSVIWDDGTVGNGLVVNAGASATGDCNVGEGVNLLVGAMNVVADPEFTTTARGYYRLDDTSPAIDLCGTGADTDLDTCDRPYGVDEDAGAFEWNDGTCP